MRAKAGALARFFEFVIARYQGDIHALTGCGGRASRSTSSTGRPRPSTARSGCRRRDDEIDDLFAGWRDSLPDARKYLPAARDYLAASLWRRVGLRINETVMLDIRDWRPDLGEHGKLHVRFGKGSRGRGPKTRLVPGDQRASTTLIDWWLADVRHQFGDDWDDPDAPLLPSERRDRDTGRCDPGRAPRRCAPGWPARSPGGCRRGRAG